MFWSPRFQLLTIQFHCICRVLGKYALWKWHVHMKGKRRGGLCQKQNQLIWKRSQRRHVWTQRTTHTKAQGSVHWFQALWLHSSTELRKKGCVHGLEWRNVLMISLALLGFDGRCMYVISLHHFCHFSVALSFFYFLSFIVLHFVLDSW